MFALLAAQTRVRSATAAVTSFVAMTSMMCLCWQSMARTAGAEDQLKEAQALRATAERQAEQAIACLQGLTDGAKDDAASRELLRVCCTVCYLQSCKIKEFLTSELPYSYPRGPKALAK